MEDTGGSDVYPPPASSPTMETPVAPRTHSPRTARRRLRVTVLACDPSSPLKARADEDFDYPHAEESDRIFVRELEAAGFDVAWQPVHLGNVDAIVDTLDCDVVFNL